MLAVFSRAGWPVERRFESGVVDLDFSLDDTEEFLRLGRAPRAARRLAGRSPASSSRARSPSSVPATTPGRSAHALWQHVTAAAKGEVFPVNPAHPTRRRPAARAPACRTSPPTSTSPSSPCRPPPCRRSIEDCIAARVRGAVIITSIEGTDIDIDAARHAGAQLRRPPHRTREHGRRRAAPVGRRRRAARARRPATGRGRHLPAVRLARRVGAAAGRRPAHGPVVVRLARRQERRVGQRPAAVLGGRRDDAGHRDVHRVVRQRPQVRPHRPPGVAAPPDRRRAHRRRGDRTDRRRAVPAGRADRGADRRRHARHGPGPRHPARDARAAGGAAGQRRAARTP